MSRSPPLPARLARVLAVLGLGGAMVLAVGLGVVSLLDSSALRSLPGRLSPGPFLLAIVAWLLAAVLAGPRLRALLPAEHDGRPPPAGATLGTWMIAVHALNLALPGPAGDLAFVGVLVRRHGLPAGPVVAATVLARALGLATIAAAALIVLPLAPPAGALADALRLVLALLGVGGVGLGLVALLPHRLGALSEATLGRLSAAAPGLLGRGLSAAHRSLARLIEAFAGVARRGPAVLVGTVAWSVAIQLCLAGSLWLGARAVGVPLDALPLVLAHLSAELASVAVAITPAGLGGVDASLAAALVAFTDHPAGEAALVVLALRMVQVAALGLGTLLVARAAPELLSAQHRTPAP